MYTVPADPVWRSWLTENWCRHFYLWRVIRKDKMQLFISRMSYPPAIAGHVASTCPELNNARYQTLSVNGADSNNIMGLLDVYHFLRIRSWPWGLTSWCSFYAFASTWCIKGMTEKLGLTFLTNFIVAVCKQGTVSTKLIDKIITSIRADLGKDI